MSSWFFFSVVVISIFSILLSIYIHKPDFPPLEIDPDDYWKLDDPEKDDDTIYSFTIDIKESEVSNFKEKLESERFLPTLYDTNYDNYLNELKQVLLGFNWKQHQHFLNTFKQYKTEIEGLKIHFLRVSTPPKDKKSRVVPLLIFHGFPGSFWDFFKIIPILTNPSRHGFDFGVEEAIQFEVIVPSLPGFIFSDKPTKQGFNAIATARIIAKLMYRLNLNNYFVHGTEGYGSDVATLLSSLYPTRIAGLHLSNPFVNPTFSTFTLAKYALKAMGQKDEDRENQENRETGKDNRDQMTDLADYFKQDKFAYPTNSQAFGAAFLNSPSGTAKYIESRWKQLSTFFAETNLNELFTMDEIATEIYLYWLTDTLPSALTILDSSFNFESVWLSSQVRIPTAVSYSKQTPWRCSKDILEDRYLNLTRISELPKGGMFHHLQDGHKIAEDIFSFVELQLLHKNN
ncbi:Epoxide hydrolase [Caenorhabditis elegans]|uniref:Epoxide hydrolase n=1 Tax=Caenorhabditis elegans TaxID=6239 RepID=A4UVK7_CAEEL|nr:Epoxide hydrolase [Caenorhabditis elegans]CAM84812.1 Epoxide hydrolase [Caenorhabditis elegans]|eukprot:NP_001122878.1 Epoxide hydrolase [Caenorhabditis elegans]